MTFDVNHYLSKTYGPQPCWELVADVYNTEVGEIPVDYKTINRSVREMASAFRLAIHGSPHGFSQIEIPTDLCIVLLSKREHVGIHHCGIYYDGSVLHATPGLTKFEPLNVIRDNFEVVQFWAKASNA